MGHDTGEGARGGATSSVSASSTTSNRGVAGGSGLNAPPPSTVLTDPVAPAMIAAMPSDPDRAVTRRPRDTSDSVHGSIDLETGSGVMLARYTPTDVGVVTGPSRVVEPRRLSGPWLGLAIGLLTLIGVGLVLGVWVPPGQEPVAAQPSMAQIPVEPTPTPALEDDLRALALVNVRDPAAVLPFARRHALLDQIRRGPDAARIDRKLNVALDLQQAADSPAPCETFARALAEVEAKPDPYFGEVLASARAPDPSCVDLDARREALLLRVRPPEVSAEVTAEVPKVSSRRRSGSGRGKGRRRGRDSRRAQDPVGGEGGAPDSTTPNDATSPTQKPDSSTVGDKLDDSLRPFGG